MALWKGEQAACVRQQLLPGPAHYKEALALVKCFSLSASQTHATAACLQRHTGQSLGCWQQPAVVEHTLKRLMLIMHAQCALHTVCKD